MGDTELRWGLRQLPRELEPPTDLWPGIAARLAPPRRRTWPWLAGLALAASLVLALGLSVPARAPTASADVALLEREADALTREYQVALDQLAGAPLAALVEPDLATLDQSAVDIRRALVDDPDAVYLLEQLRRTYARRLSLTQRAAMG